MTTPSHYNEVLNLTNICIVHILKNLYSIRLGNTPVVRLELRFEFCDVDIGNLLCYVPTKFH